MRVDCGSTTDRLFSIRGSWSGVEMWVDPMARGKGTADGEVESSSRMGGARRGAPTLGDVIAFGLCSIAQDN